MERGVITEIPLYVLKMFSGPSSISSRLIGVTSHTTPLSIRRGVGGEASVFSVCRRPSVCSKCAPKSSVNSVCSVRDKTPHYEYPTIFLSQKITEEQNTQTFTETLSQPITQSVTANVSWKASVNSVCRRRSVGSKCAPKGSVNSVRSVREKTPQRER